ncbi:MAG: ribosome-associated translation inhibitor RaiA [candidate division WOR-3 bacterium]|jgi:putative sigma-54 modulation protein|nr:ribosome-associated translation inhibitor RaiA [candidate division WOR-3 bacterium]MDH7518236.1 ribosome-associated translation inhibitor RaiA [bacterium]
MQITLTARHLEITPHLREYVTKKLEKLGKFDHQILKSEVVLFQDRAYDVAEGKVHTGHFVVTAKGHGSDSYQAVNDLTDKLIIQLERRLGKIRTRRRRAPNRPSRSEGSKPQG